MVTGPGDWDASAAYTDTAEAPHGLVDTAPVFHGIEEIISSESIHETNEYGTVGLDINECWLTDFIVGVPAMPHNLLDGVTHPDTAAQGATLGSLILGDATPDWNELVVGAVGNVLTVAGGTAVWAAPGGLSAWQQVVIVAKAGGDYTIIQDAIDSIGDNSTAKRYIVLVMPGDYAENVVMEEYVSLIGFSRVDTRITIASGSAVTTPPGGGEVTINNIAIYGATVDSTYECLHHDTGTVNLWNSLLHAESATNNIQATLINQDGGTIHAEHTHFEYEMSGTHVAAQNHYLWTTAGTSNIWYYDNEADVDIADANDNLRFLSAAGGVTLTSTFNGSTWDVLMSNVAYAGNTYIFYYQSTGSHNFFSGNQGHFESSGDGLGEIFHFDSTAGAFDMFSVGNDFEMVGFNLNRSANVAAGDSMTTTNDRLIAATGFVRNGTINTVYSAADGNMWVGDELTIGEDDGDGFVFPEDDGTAGQIMETDGANQLSWVDPAISKSAETTVAVDTGVMVAITLGSPLADTPQDAMVWVNATVTNTGVVFNLLSMPGPVADMATYAWQEDGSGDLEVWIWNDTQVDLQCTAFWVDLG